MATEQDLYLGTTATPEEVKAHLLRTMPFEDDPDFKRWKCLMSETTYVQIGTESDPTALALYRDQFGIDVRLSISFIGRKYPVIGKNAVKVANGWSTQTILATLALLKWFDGDAVLMSTWDIPKLLRKDGTLTLLYEDGGIWDARAPCSLLSLVDLPYTLEPLDQDSL